MQHETSYQSPSALDIAIMGKAKARRFADVATRRKPNRVLFGTALFLAVDYCKRNGVNCSGSHLEERANYTYALTRTASGEPILLVTLSDNHSPVYIVCN